MKSKKLDSYFYKLEYATNRMIEFKTSKSIVRDCVRDIMFCCRDISNAISDEDFDSLCREACESYFREHDGFSGARNSLEYAATRVISRYKSGNMDDLSGYICSVVYSCLDLCIIGKISVDAVGFRAFHEIT